MAGDGQPRSQWLWWGIGLIVVGLIGTTAIFVIDWGDDGVRRGAFSGERIDISEDDFGSLGEQIFVTGRDEDGRLIPRSGGFGGMMGAVACVDCHGADGEGRDLQMMMFDIEAPDIRWSTLAEATEEDAGGNGGHPHEPYDQEGFTRALREGETPGGEELERIMPRWRVSDRQVEALVDYLQELSDLGGEEP